MLLAIGLFSVTNEPIVRLFVGIAGGLSLVIFGAIQIHSCLNQTKEFELSKGSTRNLFLIGFTLTGLNPYFIIWWLTIGVNLIFLSLEFAGLFGVIFMYICHVWVDYAWLTLISGLAKRSLKILQFKWYRLMIMIFGAILIYFGIYFIADALFF
jgi:threonine/homoserine/homoserine lactone efflux protein